MTEPPESERPAMPVALAVGLIASAAAIVPLGIVRALEDGRPAPWSTLASSGVHLAMYVACAAGALELARRLERADDRLAAAGAKLAVNGWIIHLVRRQRRRDHAADADARRREPPRQPRRLQARRRGRRAREPRVVPVVRVRRAERGPRARPRAARRAARARRHGVGVLRGVALGQADYVYDFVVGTGRRTWTLEYMQATSVAVPLVALGPR